MQRMRFLLMGEEKGICRQSSGLLLSLGFAHTLINVYVLLATSVHLKTDSIGK